jgi:hypothetical protein
MKMKDRISKLEEIISIQSSEGNYNYDSYHYGLLNGLILARAIITETNPEYKDKPKVFLSKQGIVKRVKAWYGSKKNKLTARKSS